MSKDATSENGKIALVGGGSGGHITPLKFIIEEIRNINPKQELVIITDHNSLVDLKSLLSQFSNINYYSISTGKFRRFANFSKLQQLMNFSLQNQNIKDLFKSFKGILDVKKIVKEENIKVIFYKGGFVSVPVAFGAAKGRHNIMHDSDSRPSLASRLIQSRIQEHFTGLDQKSGKITKRAIGIPVSNEYYPVSQEEKVLAKRALKFETKRPLIVVTGGGNGSSFINKITLEQASRLSDMNFFLITGKDKYQEFVKNKIPANLRVVEFSSQMPELFKAADAVVARAGATTVQEIANSGTLAIIIPAPQLSDQVENIKKLSKAVLILDQEEIELNPSIFTTALRSIIYDDNIRKNLSQELSSLRSQNAAKIIAESLVANL